MVWLSISFAEIGSFGESGSGVFLSTVSCDCVHEKWLTSCMGKQCAWIRETRNTYPARLRRRGFRGESIHFLFPDIRRGFGFLGHPH
jgi:hypothetical protein|tara:strand:+ start:134 stop:394 length:261 start_codon:yes stop_codon:yes gene_type:complete